MRLWIATLLFSFIFTNICFGEEEKSIDNNKIYQAEQELLDVVNKEREKFGLIKLILDPVLHKQSRNHCAWMCQTRRFMHSNYSVRENIAWGYSDVESVMVGWMNSPGHRANILSDSTRIGLSVYITEDGNIYWCQQFGN